MFLQKAHMSPAAFSFLPLFAFSQQGEQKVKFWEKSSSILYRSRQETALVGFGPSTSRSLSTWVYIKSTSTPSSAGPRPSTTSGRCERVYCNVITFLQRFQRFHCQSHSAAFSPSHLKIIQSERLINAVQMAFFSDPVRVLPLPWRLEVVRLSVFRRWRRPRHCLLQVYVPADMARWVRADRHHRALHRVRYTLPRLQEENWLPTTGNARLISSVLIDIKLF